MFLGQCALVVFTSLPIGQVVTEGALVKACDYQPEMLSLIERAAGLMTHGSRSLQAASSSWPQLAVGEEGSAG